MGGSDHHFPTATIFPKFKHVIIASILYISMPWLKVIGH
jgi:hypothetical protein